MYTNKESLNKDNISHARAKRGIPKIHSNSYESLTAKLSCHLTNFKILIYLTVAIYFN